VVFAYSLANQFYIPAEAATLPLIVPKNILPFANSLFFITVQSAIAFGLLSAGASYEYLGLGASLFLAAALLILAYTSVSLLPQIRPLERIPEDISRGVARFFAELVEGYQFIKSNQKIFMPFLLLIGLQVSLSVVIVTLPALAKDLIGVKPSLAGIAIGLPAAIGALTATAVVPKAIARGIKRRRVVELSLFFLSIAIVVLGSIVPNVHFWVGRTLAVACFVVAGASYVGSLIPTLTHLQITTPKDKLGRVFGNIWLITTAATVVPVIFSATITEVFGVSLMMSLLGLVGMTTFFLLEVRKSSFIKINGGL
jgi:MFS family permease